jgi:type II restriction enzyme
MDNYATKAIQAVNTGRLSFCKFLSANDTGDTGAHQVGIYIAKTAFSILFDEPGVRGSNKDKTVKILWQEEFTTVSRFIYYGKRTRNEYRITRFGRGFPFLRSSNTGDLFVLVKNDESDYSGYMLQTEDEIDTFLDAFAMSPADTGSIIHKDALSLDARMELAFTEFIQRLTVDFPSAVEMSMAARRIQNAIFNHEENIRNHPDKKLLEWINMEYSLFRKIEFSRYGDMITKGFNSVEEFINVANMVLNRRKSRAGKSLENHLSAIFDGNDLAYESQPRTEGNKRPDFLFPNESSYHSLSYPADRLVFLGA